MTSIVKSNYPMKLLPKKVWCYHAAVHVMTMNGWEEDGDCLRLKDESHARSHAEAMSELLGEALLRMSPNNSYESPLTTNKTPKFRENESNILDVSSSSECCAFTKGIIDYIRCAILAGNGEILKELLKSYHFACLKTVRDLQD